MKRLTNEEINAIATKYIKLKEAERSENEFNEYQNYCMDKLKFLVDRRAYKYKKFPNYLDLRQDGFEAMLLAFKTYNPKKGNFSWWADKYIKTRICRCANAHSTIKFPIKKAKELRPYKVGCVPIVIDASPNGFDTFYVSENKEMISKAIDDLPDTHKNVINKVYGFVGKKPATIALIMKELSISRPQFLKILKEAQEKIKKTLFVED